MEHQVRRLPWRFSTRRWFTIGCDGRLFSSSNVTSVPPVRSNDQLHLQTVAHQCGVRQWRRFVLRIAICQIRHQLIVVLHYHGYAPR